MSLPGTIIRVPTILAFAAHPDDETYGFGGTLALAARAGWRSVVCAATLGEGGERHDGGPPGREALAVTRRAELAASCSVLGAEPPVCWQLPDGALSAMESQAARVSALLATYQPEIVLSLGRDGAYGHPDHLALARWVTEAVNVAADPPTLLYAAFPAGLFLPQYELCRAAGIMGDPPALDAGDLGTALSHYTIDIVSAAERKLSAIAAHRTQLPRADPRALFPLGIVDALLTVEQFTDAGGYARPSTEALLKALN